MLRLPSPWKARCPLPSTSRRPSRGPPWPSSWANDRRIAKEISQDYPSHTLPGKDSDPFKHPPKTSFVIQLSSLSFISSLGFYVDRTKTRCFLSVFLFVSNNPWFLLGPSVPSNLPDGRWLPSPVSGPQKRGIHSTPIRSREWSFRLPSWTRRWCLQNIQKSPDPCSWARSPFEFRPTFPDSFLFAHLLFLHESIPSFQPKGNSLIWTKGIYLWANEETGGQDGLNSSNRDDQRPENQRLWKALQPTDCHRGLGESRHQRPHEHW